MVVTETTKKALKTSVSTHCPYCSFQCGLAIADTSSGAKITRNFEFPVNKSILCIKGWTAAATLSHPDRLLTPLVRSSTGTHAPASWGGAMAHIVQGIKDVQARYGKDAVGVLGSGSLTNEKAYLLGKFARVALETPNIDYNGRFCMSSAAAASIRAFGVDRGLPFPLEDIPGAEVILIVGSNATETMPPIMQYFKAQRVNGGSLIVADPRYTATAQQAGIHLKLAPGTDAALANGLLHILLRDGFIDEGYIEKRTGGFEKIKGTISEYCPERVERITGVPESQLTEAARMLGSARSAMVLTGRGADQQAQGVNNILAFINVALALGLVGKPLSGFGCLTGQGNGQGGREHGQKADQLPGYRKIDDPEARRHIAEVWGVPEEAIPGPGRSAYELLDSIGQDGGIRALLVFGSNVAVSSPNALHVEKRLKSLELLVVADFFMSETARHASVVLPASQWAEEDGTMTNLEGRVILRRKALNAPHGVRDDAEIICGLARRLGKSKYFSFSSPREIFDELRRASAGGIADYSGITYEKIEASNGVFWPCPGEGHPGTPRLFSEEFPTPDGRARFHPVRHESPAEEPDSRYPLYLTTGRILPHYQSGAQTRRVPELVKKAASPLAEIHPATATRYRVQDGERIVLVTRRGLAAFKVKITAGIREDTVFVPFHWGGWQAANRLTNPALDPTSKMPEFKVCAVRIERI